MGSDDYLPSSQSPPQAPCTSFRIDAIGDPEAIRRPLNAYCKALKKAGVNHNIFVRTDDGWKLIAVFDRHKEAWYVLEREGYSGDVCRQLTEPWETPIASEGEITVPLILYKTSLHLSSAITPIPHSPFRSPDSRHPILVPLSSTQVPGGGTEQMEFIDIQSLNDDEMRRLVSITLEEFGPDFNRARFNEVMLGLVDQIAGLETLSRKRSLHYLKLLWLKYQQAILANSSRH